MCIEIEKEKSVSPKLRMEIEYEKRWKKYKSIIEDLPINCGNFYMSYLIAAFFLSNSPTNKKLGAAAYQLGNTSSRTITEVKQC